MNTVMFDNQKKNPNVNYRWIEKKLKDVLRVDINVDYEVIKQLLKMYRAKPNDWQLFKAKVQDRVRNEGTLTESYHKLFKYFNLLKETDLGIVIVFDNEKDYIAPSQNLQFKRVFVYLHAMKVGFLEAYRPFIAMDSCHLKGQYDGSFYVLYHLIETKNLSVLHMVWLTQSQFTTRGFFLKTFKGMH